MVGMECGTNGGVILVLPDTVLLLGADAEVQMFGTTGPRILGPHELVLQAQEATEITVYIKEDFKRHGLLQSTKTPEGGQGCGVVLGTGVDPETRR